MTFADQPPQERKKHIREVEGALLEWQRQHRHDTAKARTSAAQVKVVSGMLAQMRRVDAEASAREAKR